jgi:hypothetical protein
VANKLAWDKRKKPLAERYWSKVDKSGGPDACWPWTAGRSAGGYGILRNKDRGLTRLTREQVIEMRLLRKREGTSSKDLAERFGVCREMVDRILSRRAWKHVPEDRQSAAA